MNSYVDKVYPNVVKNLMSKDCFDIEDLDENDIHHKCLDRIRESYDIQLIDKSHSDYCKRATLVARIIIEYNRIRDILKTSANIDIYNDIIHQYITEHIDYIFINSGTMIDGSLELLKFLENNSDSSASSYLIDFKTALNLCNVSILEKLSTFLFCDIITNL